jgi:anti-sigma B factor antagonist
VSAGEQLRVEITADRDRAIVHLDGELDLASAPLLQSEIESPEVAGSTAVVLDLRDLQFIDSTGLRTIFSAHAQARERGQQFAITRGSDQVQRLLGITGVEEHLRVLESPEDLLV